MSSQRASYQLSAAQRAALQEAARLRQLQRQWQAAQLERNHQHRRAARLRQRYQVEAPTISLLTAAASGTGDALAQDLATATAKTVKLTAELDSIEKQGRRQAIHTMVATIIGAVQQAPARQTPQPVHREQAMDEADRIVGRLDPEVDQSALVGQILETIARTPRNRCEPLLAALRAEVGELNEAAVRRRCAAAVLVSARAVAEQTGDRSLATLLTAMQAEFDTDQTIDVNLLEQATEAALRRDEQQREHAHVLRVVMEAFGEIHYQVLVGVEVNTPSEGVLVRRDNGASRAVHVQIDSGVISVTPARLTSAAVGVTRAGDIDPEAERLVCQDATDVWQRIDHAGVQVAGRALRLNSTVPRDVHVPDEALPASPTRRAVPKVAERRLP
ncbi:MAG: hypothetical protein ACRDSZ_11660 [Pseudonocardiaceae bacterium]